MVVYDSHKKEDFFQQSFPLLGNRPALFPHQLTTRATLVQSNCPVYPHETRKEKSAQSHPRTNSLGKVNQASNDDYLKLREFPSSLTGYAFVIFHRTRYTKGKGSKKIKVKR